MDAIPSAADAPRQACCYGAVFVSERACIRVEVGQVGHGSSSSGMDWLGGARVVFAKVGLFNIACDFAAAIVHRGFAGFEVAKSRERHI